MLKRLIIAVFALSLVLSLSGTAFSDVSNDRYKGLEKHEPSNPANPNYKDGTVDARPATPSQRANMNDPTEFQALSKAVQKPITPPSGSFCDVLDNTGPWSGAFGLPGSGGLRTSLAQRFFSEPGNQCTVKGAFVYPYLFFFSGTPDLMVYLYDDDGFGLPGAKLDSVLVSYACLVDTLCTARPDITDSDLLEVHVLWPNGPWVFDEVEKWHIAVERRGVGSMAILGDAADGPYVGDKRGSIYRTDIPGWASGIVYFGTDRNFAILAERCCGPQPYSDCYSLFYYGAPWYGFNLPNGSGSRIAHADRFSTVGPETLKSADVYLDWNDPGVDLKVDVYADAGGLPTGPSLATATIPSASLVLYPSANNFDLSAFNLVFEGDFHIAVSAPGAIPGVQNVGMISDNETDGPTGRGSVHHAGIWKSVLAGVGIDVDFLIDANMCKDQFAICETDNDNYAEINYALRLPRPDPGYGITAYAQKFFATNGESCKLKELGIYWQWNNADAARSLYDSAVIVQVCGDAGGFPGAVVGSFQITQADFTAAGDVGYVAGGYLFYTLSNLEPMNITLSGPFWIVLRSTAASFAAGGTRPMMDVATGTAPVNGSAVESTEWPPVTPGWDTEIGFWGDPNMDGTEGLLMDLKICCAPFPEYSCLTPKDWNTSAGNFQRTSRSDATLGDAFCDLNLRWNYTHPSATLVYAGPVVYKGRVMQVWQDRVIQFDIATGGINFTLGPGAPYGSDMRCTPTATTIDIAGTPTDVVYLITGGQRAMVCVNWITGAVIWSVPGPNGAGGGGARWGITSVANQGGTEVVYHCTEIGRVVARVAATGALFGGWATNPIVLAGGASDVINTYNPDANLLYFGDLPASGNGDIYAVNAATGAFVWTLSSTGGLQGNTIWGANNGDTSYIPTPEGFSSHVAYENGTVYFNSRSQAPSSGDQFPADGIYYQVNALTGALVRAVQSQATYYSAPFVDANNVIIASRSHWAAPWNGGELVSIDKNFGLVTWAWDHPSGQGLYMPGLITCEPNGDADQIFIFGQQHFMTSVNANTGAPIWERRMDYGSVLSANSKGAGVAMSKDGELVVSDEGGGIAVLAKTTDRARLQFLTYRPGGNVNFGVNPALAITSNWLIKNTGCLPLNITGTAVNSTSATGEFLPGFAPKPIGVGTNLLTTSSSIADRMTSAKWGMAIRGDGSADEVVSSRESVNSAALAAPPVWWVSLDDPNAGDVIMPGDSMELKITINQPLLSRGPNYAWITIESDDPDFFLNDAAKDPECRLRLIGGCLADTSLLTFGMGSANYRMVWNTGRIADGDEEPSHGFHIDNVASEHAYFQGSYIYAITLRRAAWNSKEWSGSTIDEWWSMQGDYNWCDNTCKPAIVSPYAVPAMSTDGITYNAITANMVCRSYIDSVQNFWTGATWNLRLYSNAPFDNDSTIGLLVKSRVIGAVDVPELNNVTVDIMEVTERNGRKVPNWYMGSFADYDIGTGDTSGLDRSVSCAYAWAKGQANGIWGEIKLPFGCGQDPMRNTKGMVGASGLYPNAQPYFDSLYKYLSAAPGTHASQVTTGADFEQANSFIKKDTIFPNESFTYAIAHFGFNDKPHGGSGAVAPAIVKNLARLVNKWTGWGRGDVNNDNVINLADVVYLGATVNFAGPGAIPFEHLGDVNASGGAPNQADVDYLINFYFGCGPCPAGAWTM